MNKLEFLGRGAGYHVKEGNTAGYIRKNKTLLLIDCGETVFKKILEKDLIEGVEEIHVLITHMHSDHIGSLGGFIGFCYWKYKIVRKIYFNEKEKISMFLKLLGLKEGESFIVDDTKNKGINSLKLEFSTSITKHVKVLNTYSYTLKFDEGNDIFYSGDIYETNFDVIPFLKLGNLIYHDTCLNDFEGNVHTSLKVLSEIIPMEYRKQVYCIHIDGDDFIEKAEKEGFNVVDIG
ncbi:metallo-beta-lactamase superfamily protein [Clostridium argentinense CDC 2741]|uniref:Metallo-beta-lactamase superfamily protein n=1 Tax=Clostridium argentinense CDC 2741 TaxID=1418104 RepID=A0A0C1UGS6_9CLOT|nr:MBL fold metallo-hydrolase [Clostridium argentinense]ARC86393.1 metal-dependent hydrolase [Clostridium argentinense]KIE46605.1 metallo-beta-lactamase superfamily protein [Clostridium argentinense CDC 2741]NFF37852.1 MBL fold metallo-hydrolase [Clostridium argentinense]NFP49916.1 MBL fold metallo-hydrolase [Clostridium argentinense]NFP71244.1 MBL fold metallo-hydrolase [Clostridium argentinense]